MLRIGPALHLSTPLSVSKNAEIAPLGGGLTESEAYSGTIIERNGYSVGFLGYTNLIPASFGASGETPGVARIDRDRIASEISDLEAKTDYIVVTYHWGDEYQKQANQHQRDLAHYSIDSGADFVIGHHPHVLQEIEEYNNGLIAYSLGNFVFDQHFSTTTTHSMILTVDIEDSEVSHSSIPIEIKPDYRVILDSEK